MSPSPEPALRPAVSDQHGSAVPWLTILFLLFVPTILWVLLDRSVWLWDQAAYGKTSVDFLTTFRRSFGEWITVLFRAVPQRTPGLLWVGQLFVPLGLYFGDVAKGLLLYILLLEFISAALVYKTVDLLFENSRAALISVLFLCGASIFVALGHNYFTEPFQGLGVALFFYFLAGADRRSLIRSALLLGTSGIIAILGKVSSPLYLFCPSILFACLCYRRRRQWRHEFKLVRTDLWLGLVFLGCLLLFATWCLPNYKAALAHVATASSGAASVYYGTRAGLLYKIPFWTKSFESAFLHSWIRPVSLLALVAFVITQIRTRPKYGWAEWVTVSGLAQIAMAILVFSMNINEDSRFLFCLFPFLFVGVGWVFHTLDGARAFRSCWTVGLLQFALVTAEAFGITPLSHELSPHLAPIDFSGDKRSQLEFVAVQTCSNSSTPRPAFIVGINVSNFNMNSLGYYASVANVSTGRVCDYFDLGYDVSDPNKAWNRIFQLNPEAVLYLTDELERVDPTNPFNQVDRAIFDQLRASPLFKVRPMKSAPNLMIFELKGAAKWRIESALFSAQAAIWTPALGVSVWRVHPAHRKGGPQTVLTFDGSTPAHAIFSGTVVGANSACPGIEMELTTAGTNPETEIIRLAGPLLNKSFSQPLHNSLDDPVSIRLRSFDPDTDNIDGCWITFGDITLAERRPRR